MECFYAQVIHKQLEEARKHHFTGVFGVNIFYLIYFFHWILFVNNLL